MNKNAFLSKGLLFLVLILNLKCSKNEETSNAVQPFSVSDLAVIHGNSQKQWKITDVIYQYPSDFDELSYTLGCLDDDVYTFFSDNEEVQVELGEQRCFGSALDDAVFSTYEEFFLPKLMHDGTTIIFKFYRGYETSENGMYFGGGRTTTFKLAELSEDRMLFFRAGGDEDRDYGEALIFERVQ